uniref:Uncharacterized protein n=1 Tax=Kalanchoe fedtschenkoi TaxID=63787 RepID=A0A7N0TJP8_KALFE
MTPGVWLRCRSWREWVGEEREREGDAVSEMVAAINKLADGFVKTEQKKMEMAREIEVMRMDMETKRLKMVLDQRNFWDLEGIKLKENKEKLVRNILSKMTVEQLSDLVSFHHMMAQICSSKVSRRSDRRSGLALT